MLYKTYDKADLAIVQAFMTWCHYVEISKYNIFVVTD